MKRLFFLLVRVICVAKYHTPRLRGLQRPITATVFSIAQALEEDKDTFFPKTSSKRISLHCQIRFFMHVVLQFSMKYCSMSVIVDFAAGPGPDVPIKILNTTFR